MNAATQPLLTQHPSLANQVAAVCQRVAPTWPLDRMIAVSPYWQRIDQPFSRVAADLARLAGSPLTLPLADYRAYWQSGQIQRAHLARALAELAPELSVATLVNGLHTTHSEEKPAPLYCDILDSRRDLRHEPAWCDTLTHQIGQFCAAYFDRDQADWHPDQTPSLYSSWRAALSQDHSVALLMRARQIPARASTLPNDALSLIGSALSQLGIAEDQWQDYLEAVLFRVSGWAAWCAYRRWQARLAGQDDATLIDLLAIRVAWECLLDDGERQQGSVWQRWQEAWRDHQNSDRTSRLQHRQIWQRAHEISYQSALFSVLTTAQPPAAAPAPQVQAVFCIDVRSEVYRRHLEAQSPAIQTLGFAGFFGLPISYTPLGSQATRPQLPGLLAPALAITDSSGDRDTDRQIAVQRHAQWRAKAGWRAFSGLPGSAFTLVEALGLGYAAKLVQRSLPQARPARLASIHPAGLRPRLSAVQAGGVARQADLAAAALTGMNLTERLAPLVLLIGHGSQTRNNPQRAGLDCGACCGQTGEANARALADLLNDSTVRTELQTRGITIPDQTHFIAGLHNTTTDTVMLFDTAGLPANRQAELAQLQAQLAAASQATRRERAPGLGLAHLVGRPKALARALHERSNDWSETRPEWGLANNAAFIIAPRARTRGLDLQGRSFLHDYDHRHDPDGQLLAQIMTAPMLVTHWINMQYYASTVDPQRYGSGNKTLHNVVAGRVGVFEGNGGDLRIGLAQQSVHDGEQWRHQPLRLTVVIDAPRAFIDQVIAQHDTVRQLVSNRWLYVVRWEGQRIEPVDGC